MPLVVRAAVTSLLLAAVSPASASASPRLIVRLLPRPAADQVLVARASGRGSLLERWQVQPPRRLAALRVPGRVADVAPAGRFAALQSDHRLDLVPADLGAPPRPLWRTRLRIVRTLAFRGGWLVLACRGMRGGHPQGGQVTYVSTAGARRLGVSSLYNFWDMQAADVDGTGRPEVALCTWSRTRTIPSYARRYFVYGWDGRDLYPRWCGSRLSKPYRQARLVRFDERPASGLLSVERSRTGRWRLVAYCWTGFGFAGLGQSEELADAEVLEAPGPPALVRVVRRGGRPEVCAVELRRSGMRLAPLCRLAAGKAVVAGRFAPHSPAAVALLSRTRAGAVRLQICPRPALIAARRMP